MVTNLKLTDHAYSDHKMLEFLVKEKTHPSIQEPVRMRDQSKYNKESLMEKLNNEDWTCTRNDSQSFYNWLESKIVNLNVLLLRTQ